MKIKKLMAVLAGVGLMTTVVYATIECGKKPDFKDVECSSSPCSYPVYTALMACNPDGASATDGCQHSDNLGNYKFATYTGGNCTSGLCTGATRVGGWSPGTGKIKDPYNCGT